MRPLALAGLLALLSWGAGHAQTGPAPRPLADTSWTLTALTEGGQLVTPGEAVTRPTLRLGGRLASGVTPCNIYRATYAARADVLRFGSLATTRRACPDRVDGLEGRFVTLLRGVSRYERRGDTLTLYAGGGDRLVFTAGSASAPSGPLRPREEPMNLDGNWLLGGGTALAPVPGRAPTLTFVGGRVSGRGGCNRLTGPTRLVGQTLTLGPLAVTRMACEPEVNVQEAAFLAFLGAPLTAWVEGETLTLTNPAGKTLVFRRTGPSR